jgi:hypothetical protein
MHTRKFILAALLLLASLSSFGQFSHATFYHKSKSYYQYGEKGRKAFKRMYMSVSLPFMNYDLTTTLNVDRSVRNAYSNQPGQSIDTTLYLSSKASGSFGFSMGSFFPLARLGQDQALAVDWNTDIYWYSFKFNTVQYSPEISANKHSEYILVDIPIALVFKTGGEVSQDRKKNPLFSFGAGFAPTFIAGGYESAATLTGKMRTFVMAEVGMHFGVAAKLRFTYFPGDLELLNDETGGLTEPNTSGSFSAHGVGSSNFVVSLVFLPYSGKWGDEYNYNSGRHHYRY